MSRRASKVFIIFILPSEVNVSIPPALEWLTIFLMKKFKCTKCFFNRSYISGCKYWFKMTTLTSRLMSCLYISTALVTACWIFLKILMNIFRTFLTDLIIIKDIYRWKNNQNKWIIFRSKIKLCNPNLNKIQVFLFTLDVNFLLDQSVQRLGNQVGQQEQVFVRVGWNRSQLGSGLLFQLLVVIFKFIKKIKTFNYVQFIFQTYLNQVFSWL